ncbi:MAG: glycosyltransferase family 39 protein, partial [bacterium]|nr:glycosyltransferase family 39 protein [bacterium]
VMCRSAQARAKELSTKDVLHEQQRVGWRCILDRKQNSNEVGPRWDLWILVFLVFIILSRTASVALFHTSLLNREWGFFTLVDHWFSGYGYSFVPELGCASAYRSPGYLFFLTALYSVFRPENTLAQAIAQNIFVVGILWLVYSVGKRLVGKRAALIGGFLMAVYPYTFYHYTQYYHTFLSSFFLLLVIWFVSKLADTKHWRNAIGAGLSIGALAYVQGTILVATPFIVLWLFWVWKWDWKRTMKAAVIMAVFSAGLIAPWTYRNWKQLHAFVPLTTDLGHAFFKANNEVIYELTKRGYPQEVVDTVTVSSTDPNYKQYRLPIELEESFKRDGVFRDSVYWTAWHPTEPALIRSCDAFVLNEVESDRYWKGLAKNWISQHWSDEMWKLQLLKLKTFWQPALFPSVKMGALWSFSGNPIKVWLARNAMTTASAVVIFGGFIGMTIAVRKRKKDVWLVVLILFVYSAMHTLFAGYTKYRIPLDNLLAIYAGSCLILIWDWFRGSGKHDI